jgi:tRNA modification GTPase
MTAGATNGVVLLTPPGRGAIASVLVEGPRAAELVARRFRPLSGRALDDYPPRAVVVGRWGGPQGEQVVVCRQQADWVEVHCHGGSAAVGALIEGLVQLGCRQLPWTDWLSEREVDPIRLAARRALADTRTQPAAAILLDQYAGALRRGLRGVERAVLSGDLRRPPAWSSRCSAGPRWGGI